MASHDSVTLRRLTLQVERALVAQSQFRALLAVATSTLAEHRLDLRTAKAHMKRAVHR